MKPVSHTDLILNPDGSVYHLALLPEDIADSIILVGDPGRVALVSSHFEKILVKKDNREFVTHTGLYKGRKITALSTGIGCDNIDIVINELDALVNMDLDTRLPKKKKKSLRFVRLGTSGALHREIEPGSRMLTRIACGFDGLYHYYKDPERINLDTYTEAYIAHTDWKKELPSPYFIPGSEELIDMMLDEVHFSGITISTPGFYAPQFRSIRLSPFEEEMIEKIASFRHEEKRINNFEMESSALYALSAMLGHRALAICIAIANRVSTDFLDDYHPQVNALVLSVLDKLAKHD